MSKETDELPVPITINQAPLVVTPPDNVARKMSLEEQIDIEVEAYNQIIRGLYYNLGNAKTVSSLCKATDQIMKAIEHRRHIMLRPYGYQSKNSKGNDPIELID